jgi:hypothetical protein
MFEGAIVSSFSIPWKTTARQLAAFQVILQALATDAFSGTRIVTAVAFLKVLLFLTLHQFASNALPRFLHFL